MLHRLGQRAGQLVERDELLGVASIAARLVGIVRAKHERPPTNARVTTGIVRATRLSGPATGCSPSLRRQEISRTSSTSARLPTAMEPTSSAMPLPRGLMVTSANAFAMSSPHWSRSVNTASSSAAG